MAQRPEAAPDLAKAHRQALVETRRGVHPRRVLDGLMKRGLPEAQAARLVAAATEEVADDRIAAGRRTALLGALLLVVGLGLTAFSLVSAAGGGRIVVLYYGAILVGGAQLGTGLAQVRRWQARLAGSHRAARPTTVARRRN